MKSIEELPPLREVIAKNGLSARKPLGQNFLMDLNLSRKLARNAGELNGHDVLEIGAGPGGLTRGLLMEGARRVLAVEKDSRFAPALEEIKRASEGRLEVRIADGLLLDYASILKPPIKVVSNLPYNCATAFLVRWMTPAKWPPYWTGLTLMFQTEVAERIVARPSTKSYGRLSILVQWRADPKISARIPAKAFVPEPKVSSAVVQIECRQRPRHEANAAILFRVVACAFGQRRKTVRSSLRRLIPNVEERIVEAGVDPQSRADALSVRDYCAIARAIENCPPNFDPGPEENTLLN